jgi:hypothetical protein
MPSKVQVSTKAVEVIVVEIEAVDEVVTVEEVAIVEVVAKGLEAIIAVKEDNFSKQKKIGTNVTA